MLSSIDVANMIISVHVNEISITNLALNKLVYFAQVEALKRYGQPLFADGIEAWEYGPVEPNVYRTFKHYGRKPIQAPSNLDYVKYIACSDVTELLDDVVSKFGRLTAYDLVSLTHRSGSAWAKTYVFGLNNVITNKDIMESTDMDLQFRYEDTLASSVNKVDQQHPNLIKLLENS